MRAVTPMWKRRFLRDGIMLALIAAPALTAPASAEPVALPLRDGGTLLPVKVDAGEGKVFLTLPAADSEGISGRFLYTASMKTALGSAAIRIDRGMQGPTRILAFRRVGKKVAALFENPRYRATGDAAVRKGATNSFPVSIVAMLDIAATAPGGGLTVDLSPLLTSDTLNLAGALNAAAKGFRLSAPLSAVDAGATKAFPENIEMESVLTFMSDTPGTEVSGIAPDGRQVSFTVHHSFVKLPEPGFVQRKFDIRSGANATQIYDYGSPLGQPVLVELANHFRLEKVDPTAPRSRVKKPIVYYIDNAAPEPIRSALAEGVSWWNQAFEAAGFIDAFQVRILPPDADPQDVRYNVVNWADRQNRSWSYGGGVIDPRTGEIIKGVVVLGALRLRQDIAIFEGMVGTAQNDTGGPNDAVRVALARIRQLGAHEVGHSLGFVHNFQASLQDRASVMDYPAPLVKIADGKLDLSDAYAVGIGRWDKFTIDWLYGQPAPGTDPDAAAARKARAAQDAGMLYSTDIDGRASDLAVPGTNMWTEGKDTPEDLAHALEVRRIALAGFGPAVLQPGEPLSNLRRKFVPIWLYHRYEVEAMGKIVGGVRYGYSVVGDGSGAPVSVSAPEQIAALDALVATLSPKVLTVPPALALQLSSGVNGRGDPQYDMEVLDSAGAAVFDPLVAADVGAQVTLDSLLAPSRLTRLLIQHGRDPHLPGLDTLLGKLDASVVSAQATAVERRIALRTLLSIAHAQRDPATSVDVAAALGGYLDGVARRFDGGKGSGEAAAWQRSVARLLGDDGRLSREIAKGARPEPAIPPGMPIGGDTGWFDNE